MYLSPKTRLLRPVVCLLLGLLSLPLVGCGPIYCDQELAQPEGGIWKAENPSQLYRTFRWSQREESAEFGLTDEAGEFVVPATFKMIKKEIMSGEFELFYQPSDEQKRRYVAAANKRYQGAGELPRKEHFTVKIDRGVPHRVTLTSSQGTVATFIAASHVKGTERGN